MEKRIPNDIFFAEVERLIAEGQDVSLTLIGTSMRPFLQNGRDRVVLSPFSDRELVPGAVVLFRYRGNHLLHRIISRNGEQFEIQGDSVPHCEQATISDVVAIVKEVVRPNGRTIRNGSYVWDWIYRRHIRRKRTMRFLSRVKRTILGKSIDK